MEVTKKEMIIFTIVNFFLLVIGIGCVFVMDFNLLSLIFGTYICVSILVSSIRILNASRYLKD